MNPRTVLATASIALLAATCAQQPEPQPVKTYTNPIISKDGRAGADPAVVRYGDTYYMLTTNGSACVFTSIDLITWKKGPQVLPDGFKGCWAPEFYYHPENGKYYIYYTKKYKIGVAEGTRPDSMFTDKGILAVPGIDPHLFRDDDARLYLYFTNTPNFDMTCVPMKDPLTTGGPVTRCFEISQEWEKRHFAINEGPWMLKKDGHYQLLYCGGDGQSRYYSIGVATAPTPIGPFTKYDKNPTFSWNENINAPAHGSVIDDKTGQLWHLHHQKIDTAIGWARDICIDPCGYDTDGIWGGIPSRGEKKPGPVLDPGLVWHPEIHPRGAVFNKSVTVSITCATDDAAIRYTTDGTEPTAASKLYEKPFTVNATATVTAKAFKKGMRNSHPFSQAFTQTEEALASNPAPDAPRGENALDVFEKAVIDWKPLTKKTINKKKKK